jgi:hypothetical protein
MAACRLRGGMAVRPVPVDPFEREWGEAQGAERREEMAADERI